MSWKNDFEMVLQLRARTSVEAGKTFYVWRRAMNDTLVASTFNRPMCQVYLSHVQSTH